MGLDDLYVTPSTLEVDYDKNLTELYRAITDQDWDTAVAQCELDGNQAATWVVRHYQEDEDDDEAQEDDKEIMWRFLPIHSACARQPPARVISALLRAYPDGAACVDDQGMYALHYACGNQASRDVIRQLLVNFPAAAKIADPRGMLPIHYLACWGPSSVAVIDMLLVAHRDVASTKDAEGKTPLELALEGDYPERDAVVSVLQKWLTAVDLESTCSKASRASSQKSRMAANNSNTTNSNNSRNLIANKQEEKETFRRTKAIEKEQEEKKEEDEPVMTMVREAAKQVVKPLTEAERLQQELSVLKKEMKARDEFHEREVSDSSGTWKKRYEDLERKALRQEDELAITKEELEEVHNELEKKVEVLARVETEYAEVKEKLQSSTSELVGLRRTLGDLMEQQQSFKKKSGTLNGRLGSLSASLESMLEQQSMLESGMKKRGEASKSAVSKRQELLKELLDLEDEIEEDEKKLETAFKKQTREMEAIAAVIAAARD